MQDSTEAPGRFRFLPWLAFGIVFIYLILVWQGLHGPFVFDDMPNLGALSKAGPIDSWQSLGIYLSEARSFPGRPLSMLSFVPQQNDWPDNPFPFKLVNLALHFLNAVLVFLLIRFVVRAMSFADRRRATVVALIAAAAWLVHPIQLSAVFLVVQRMTLLSTSFVLLGLITYLHGVLSEDKRPLVRAAWMAAGIGIFGVLAILCKETGAMLPVYALALDATLLRRQTEALPTTLRWWRRGLLYTAPILLLSYILIWQPGLHEAIPIRNFTVAERLLTEARVLLDYLGKIVLPRYADFGIYHDDFTVSRGLFDPWTTAPAILAVLSAVGAAFWKRKQWPLFSFAVFWYLGGQLMESTAVPLEIYFEHRNYLPIAGPILALTLAVAGTPAGLVRRVTLLAAGIWLGACLLASALYAQVWSDAGKLAHFWAVAHPGSVRAQGDLAEWLFRAGDSNGARAVMEKISSQNERDVGLAMNLLLLDCLSGNATPDQVASVRSQAALANWSSVAYQSLASLQTVASQKRCGSVLDDNAWLSLSDALLANPAFRADPVAMGNLHYQRHSLAVSRGDLSIALAELQQTAAIDPDPEIVRLQAKYLADAGLYQQAIQTLRNYDPATRPLLRRLLVDDASINQEHIRALATRQARPATPAANGH